MSDILFPQDTTWVTPATWDIILIADVSDSNNPKDCTLAELPISTATQTALDTKEDESNKNIPNGYAWLDWSGKVPSSLLTPWIGLWDVSWPASSTDNALARMDWATWKVIQNGVITESDNWDFANVNAIQMDITPTSIPTGEWVISWNSIEKTLDVQTGLGGSTLQVWREMHMQVRNNTGSTITNWSVVYINGAASSMPTVALAQANDYIKSIKML